VPDFHHPPPAYSEQEFNQKTSRALELSSRADQPDLSRQEQLQWEEWDDAVFEAAARAQQALDNQSSSTTHSQSFVGGSSTLFSDNTQPLRIQKQRKADRKSEPKPPPTWLEEAEYGPSPGRGRSSTASWEHSNIQHHDVHPEESQAIPPPPFAPPDDGQVRLAYDLPESPIPSPLTSPSSTPASLPSDDSAPSGRLQQHNMRPGNHLYSPMPARQRLPNPPHSPNYPPPTSVPVQNLRSNNIRPESGASASLLYQQRSQTVPQAFDAGAFYHPAVSAHLKPLSMPPRQNANFPDHRQWNSPPTQPSQPTQSSTPSHGREMTNASQFYPRHLHSSYSRPSRGTVRTWATTEQANYP
jgi:hypothetical protein